MFEKVLSEQFKRIFDLPKVSYDQPGESQEQNCLFIDVAQARSTVKDGRVVGRVEGTGYVYANAAQIPFTYFAKQIAKAAAADTKDLFFYQVDGNEKGFVNIVRRSFSFVYLFNMQYDPDTGSMESISFEE